VRGLVPAALLAAAVCARPALAEDVLGPEGTLQALAAEISGETAKRQLELLVRQHRMRGSTQYRAAAEHIASELRRYGLDEVRIEELPADGKVFYGTQRSRPAWDAELGELWELGREGTTWRPLQRIASFDAMPITLAQDSASGEATADLVDVGAGTSDADYAGKVVRGALVLASAQPGEVARIAVEKLGAVGIVSYAQNQRTAWWGEDERLVRWGHLDTFAPTPSFAFMVSLKQARAWQARLRKGETVRLSAKVKAGQRPGSYDVVQAVLRGADPQLREQEIVFSCHLDHPRPGANDNASGCAAILETARAYAALVAGGRIPRPARTLRFVWPPEIEGTLALLNAHPELVSRARAAIHLDMVGGGPETKAVFHVARGPASLPSFVYDVGQAVGARVNNETRNFAAARGRVTLDLHAPEGGREPLLADLAEFSLGSDHQVYTDTSFGIPAVYLHDWPDRYIHTNFDLPAHIDPTKLKRAAFIGAATAAVLANLRASDLPALTRLHEQAAVRRAALALERRAGLPAAESDAVTRFALAYEESVSASIARYLGLPAPASTLMATLRQILGPPAPRGSGPPESARIFRRNPEVKGPAQVFGYDYLDARLGRERAAALSLPKHSGLRAEGEAYAYDVLNLVDGRRSVQAIRDDVSAIHGPVPLSAVLEYLHALEAASLVR
jgi:aminopeptidase YwaD